MDVLIASLMFAAASFGAWEFFRPREDVIARRIRAGGPMPLATERRLAGGPGHRLLLPLMLRFGNLVGRLVPTRLIDHIEHMLVMADSRRSTVEFLATWGISAGIGLGLLWYVWSSNPNLLPTQLIMMILGVTLVFGIGPYGLLRRRVKARQKAISRALPDALDLLVTGVEAGLAIDAAFAMVTEKTGGPLAQAFSLYLKEVGLGRSRREALTAIADRTGVPDLIRFAAAMIQAEQVGTTIADVLRAQAEDLRILRRQRAQEAAQKAPVKMTIPLATCFMPAMFTVVVVPAALNIMDFVGRMGGQGSSVLP